MLLNWIYNFKYSKKHVAAAKTIQRYARGFIARRHVEDLCDKREQMQQAFIAWHGNVLCIKKIYAAMEHEKMHLESQIEEGERYHIVNRTYQKQRSEMIKSIIDLDTIMKNYDNDGEPLPIRLFVTRGLLVKGTSIPTKSTGCVF